MLADGQHLYISSHVPIFDRVVDDDVGVERLDEGPRARAARGCYPRAFCLAQLNHHGANLLSHGVRLQTRKRV
jgi:hypothetical protein